MFWKIFPAFGSSKPTPRNENQIRGFEAISSEYRGKTMWLATLWGIFWPLMQVHGRRWQRPLCCGSAGGRSWQGTMTLGEFVAFNGYLAMLTWPLMADRLYRQSISARYGRTERIAEVLDTPIAPRYVSLPMGDARSGGQRRYRDSQSDLCLRARSTAGAEEYQLDIPAGESAASSAKPVRARALWSICCCGLYEPPDGTILIDGVDIKRIALRPIGRGDRLCFAGYFSFLRLDQREYSPRHRKRRSRRCRGSGAHGAAAADDSNLSARGSRPSSASAACACPADKSNGRRWPARSSKIRRS